MGRLLCQHRHQRKTQHCWVTVDHALYSPNPLHVTRSVMWSETRRSYRTRPVSDQKIGLGLVILVLVLVLRVWSCLHHCTRRSSRKVRQCNQPCQIRCSPCMIHQLIAWLFCISATSAHGTRCHKGGIIMWSHQSLCKDDRRSLYTDVYTCVAMTSHRLFDSTHNSMTWFCFQTSLILFAITCRNSQGISILLAMHLSWKYCLVNIIGVGTAYYAWLAALTWLRNSWWIFMHLLMTRMGLLPNSVHGGLRALSAQWSGQCMVYRWCSEQRLGNYFPLRRKSFPLHVAGERTVVSAGTKDCKSITITFQEYCISDYFAIHAPIPTLYIHLYSPMNGRKNAI